jgi:flagellin
MTRINTNVSSLVAQNRLQTSNKDLQTALTRLSTGLRINSGSDDPAGLIASEALRSEITSLNKSISNTRRASQIISTADSALGQVSSLLNDIRGLVVEAANSGALSPDEIAANQLQVDSSLEAINRIAQTTTFQGRKLLDGSLDFITTNGTGAANISNLKIDQANLGAAGSIAVSVNVSTAATKAAVDISGFTAATPAVASSASLTIGGAAGVAATGSLTIAAGSAAVAASGTVSVGADTITVTADTAGAAGNVAINFLDAGAGNATSATINGTTGAIEVSYDFAAATTSASIQSAIDGLAGFTATGAAAASSTGGTAITDSALTNGADLVAATTIAVTADAVGTAGNVAINFLDAGAGNATSAAINGTTGAIEVSYDFAAATTAASIRTAIDGLTGFSATVSGSGSTTGGTAATAGALTNGAAAGAGGATIAVSGTAGQNVAINYIDAGAGNATSAALNATTGAIEVSYDFAAATTAASIQTAIDGLADVTATLTGTGSTTGGTAATGGTLAGGTAAGLGGVAANVVFELAGKNGSEVFNVSAGTSLAQVVSQINLVSDATGVAATANGTSLELRSSAYGSEALVDLRILTQGAGGNFGTGSRSTGTDIVATVNGRAANGVGNKLSINTATLDLSADLAADFTGTAAFTITGGGAQFQLGPEVVSNQQARVGIGSVNAARLGGVAGKLFQLGSGESASLANDPTLASQIVTEAIDQVTSLRGRLGAFQATTLESNLTSLNDTVANLQEAESSIRDADFAQESAKLTRAQILVQSGTNVLALANQNPQNVLSLLR